MTVQKIDAFPHILPPRYFQRLSELLPTYPSRPNVVARPALYDLDIRFRMMDRYPDYVQVLTLSSPAIEEWAPNATGLDMARLSNDDLADVVRRYPDRFLGFAANTMMEDVDRSLRELERAIVDLGALGALIYTNVNGKPWDDPRYDPFFATMARLEKPIWVHPTRPAGFADYESERVSKYGLHLKLGWPYETAVFMSRLIFSGVMDRYPSLRILTHHAGGIIPHLAGRLTLQHETPEQRSEIGLGDDFDDERVLASYRRFYGDTVFSGAHHPLRCALDFFGTGNILFGTDMPWGSEGGEMFVRETIASIEEVAADEAQRAALFEGNARRVLGLG